MSETYERKIERKYCYFTKSYVNAAVLHHKWLVPDGESWMDEIVGFECPNMKKCRKSEHNCMCIHPKSGSDPFMPERNLLADMW